MKKIKLAELKEILSKFDDTVEVQVSIETDGDTRYGNVTSSRVNVNYGILIIGSIDEDEDDEEEDEEDEEETT